MARNLKSLLFMGEVLESSSSSDEDTEMIMRIIEKTDRPKVPNYIEVINAYSDDEFKRNFRLSREMYQKVRDMYVLSEFYEADSHPGSPHIPANTQIMSFLWFAGNKCVIRDVAGRFNIAESTFHKITRKVMHFLNNIAKDVIKFPTDIDMKRSVAAKFEEISGFPDVIGCIDGTYISIRCPAHKVRSTYANRHDSTSITLQAVCDSEKLFLDVFTGVPSKIHDARVFHLSFLSRRIEEDCAGKWHLLGDAAYPVREFLITPYSDYGHLTMAEKNFNRKFSATRVKIENAFGLLKQRFRHLHRTEFLAVDDIAKFIISCCVLHNLCIIYHDDWDIYFEQHEQAENVVQNDNELIENEGPARATAAGKRKRDLLRDYVNM